MMRAEQGFTLIEVLVALVLMAVVSLVSWRGLDSVLRLNEHVEQDAGRDAAIVRVMGQLERDVQLRAPAFVLADRQTSPSSLPPAIHLARAPGSGIVLDIVRASATEAASWQRVRWWLEAGNLRRAMAQAGERFPLPDPGQGVAVLSGVAGFGVRAYVPGQGWAALPSQAGTPPATGLEFLVELNAGPDEGKAGPDGQPRYRRVVALP